MIKSTQPRYNITFIGAGRVAHHLAPALYDAGHKIVQIYSRNIENAKYIELDCSHYVHDYKYEEMINSC